LIIFVFCRPSSAQGKRDSDDSPDDDNDVDWSYHVDKKCKLHCIRIRMIS